MKPIDQRQARENACNGASQVTIGFRFASHWLRTDLEVARALLTNHRAK